MPNSGELLNTGNASFCGIAYDNDSYSVLHVLESNVCALALGQKQDSRSGEIASLAFMDCWQARLHLTLTRPVIFDFTSLLSARAVP